MLFLSIFRIEEKLEDSLFGFYFILFYFIFLHMIMVWIVSKLDLSFYSFSSFFENILLFFYDPL